MFIFYLFTVTGFLVDALYGPFRGKRQGQKCGFFPLRRICAFAVESPGFAAYFAGHSREGYRRITAIARRPHNAPPQRDTGPRVNGRIRAPEIRLIGADGENVGVVTPREALTMAEEAGLDLVEISPTANPPVCKIMDFGKFKYEQQKREAEARKKQKVIEIKEVKFRPGTDTHDYEVKMRSVMKFLENGDKVKVTLRFRGREMAHQQLGLELLNRVKEDVGDAGKIESMPKLEGRQMVMMIAPAK
ncbi:translation initiation factor IF-3 [Pseudothioclava arenosa]|uniref:translation initiation factor IF-3 n=1 Tax=Pseudothioclava arenosa TaxID=1795308 RepID=UPI001FE3CE7A|nr:translation initiation factor IF-3 [Pseudothioclava arenosa]